MGYSLLRLSDRQRRKNTCIILKIYYNKEAFEWFESVGLENPKVLKLFNTTL